ncbi:MAG: NAD(P)/FAD-dependent oxidoreductase [Anaerolineales bacterium]|jgi:protoporphyrinogen oxidase
MKVAIVGAGAGGLAAAYDICGAGHEVLVLEAADHVGGLAAGLRTPRWDWSVERYYHHWFASDEHMLGLIDELGWTDKVFFPRPVTVVYHEGEFYAFDSPIAVLRFPALSIFERLRLGMVIAYLKYFARWEPLEKFSAHDWLSRWIGKRPYEILWEPLLVGKFGPYYKEVNMAWFWARIKARTPRLGTFEGGFQEFFDQFASRIQSMGGRIELETPVSEIKTRPDGKLEVLANGETFIVDRCLVTSSPAALARMAPSLPGNYLDKLLDLKSMGAIVMILALKHRLSEQGFYWHNLPKSAGFPYLSMVEHTNFVSPAYFAGDHLVYVGDYLEEGHEYFALSDEELLERFLPPLKRFNPEFSQDWLKEYWVFRTSYAQPVPPRNHSRAIPDIKTPIEGLWFASMSQVYPWDRGTNFAVEIGRRAAAEMLRSAR